MSAPFWTTLTALAFTANAWNLVFELDTLEFPFVEQIFLYVFGVGFVASIRDLIVEAVKEVDESRRKRGWR